MFELFENVHKTRLFYNGGHDYNYFKDRKRVAVAKTLLKEYIDSIIGISQGSNFIDCIKEFSDLTIYLFKEFSDGKIVTTTEAIDQIKLILNNIFSNIHTVQVESISPGTCSLN